MFSNQKIRKKKLTKKERRNKCSQRTFRDDNKNWFQITESSEMCLAAFGEPLQLPLPYKKKFGTNFDKSQKIKLMKSNRKINYELT